MRISEAKECVKQLYLHTDSVSALISERGVGKTSAYKQCADELGIGYLGLYAAALEGPDFMGLPDKDREKGITRYLAPQFLPTRQAVEGGLFPPRGLLVLEEINRVPSDTTSVLYPLLLERKINGHALSEGWKVGVTMNPDTMNYTVNSLDDAMLDRFVVIEVRANLEDYLTFSRSHDANEEVLAFLEASPDLLLVVRKAADSTATSKAPTPRSWSKVQELLNHCTLPEPLMRELVAGLVGPQAAASFYGFLGDRGLPVPAIATLLADYPVARPLVRAILEARRLDLMGLIVGRAVLAFRVEEPHLANVDAFLADLPEELRVLFFKNLAVKRPQDFPTAVEKLQAFEAVADQILSSLAG